ncbi:MAG TPA: ThiF family adenylyltransferase [Candidatus Sulfotelmatobacter sp.]|nr:ThiF family adenylyltransferase [Candidatus Sulfotelmatobacter sp.]
MNYSLSFLEEDYQALIRHLFVDRVIERAAYLFCKLSRSSEETRLLVRTVIPVSQEEVVSATGRDLVIKQESYRRALKQAHLSDSCFVLVHSHPKDFPMHSPQDDVEEAALFPSAYSRIHNNQLVHGSVVISDANNPSGRVWLSDGSMEPMFRIRVLGRRFTFFDKDDESPVDIALFDRQILAFGEHVQKILSRLHIGIVGLGGTGSAVCQQLARLGVGRLTICDPQRFESTNINRIYGSRMMDEAVLKSEIARHSVAEMGIGTTIQPIPKAITDEDVAREFRKCDIIFGCTDDEWGRSILSKLSVMYLIPVFDMGVEVDGEGQTIKSVRGRVTTLMPCSACLFCRGAITPDVVGAEILHAINPGEYEKRRREGYVPGLQGNAPAVIMFTSSVASAAVSEMLHRLTGYMGSSRESTEIVLRFDESKISINSKPSRPGCWCSDRSTWGRGDVDPLLDLTWPNRVQ